MPTLSPRLGSDELSVDHVAHLLGLSRQALVHTDRPMAKIGEALGFHNPASFTRAFKTWTGQSPRDYRKTHKHDVIH